MPTPKQMEKLAAAVGREPRRTPTPGPGDTDASRILGIRPQRTRSPTPALCRRAPPIRTLRLSEIPQHILRVSCSRCGRIVEIQKADAVRLYGQTAVWKDVGQRLLDDTCQVSGPVVTKKTAAGPRSSSRRRVAGPLPKSGCPDGAETSPHAALRRRPQGSAKELGKARAMTNILAAQSAEMRAKAETMLQQADRLLCESWNERMWADGEPIDPSPTIDQAINGGFPWLEIRCSRCKTPSDVDLAAMKHPPTTFVHDLASRLRCRKCAKAGRRPAATLLQLGWQPRHPRTEP